MEDQIKCPKCGSTQIHADKKGFSGKKAVAGAVLTGGIGLLAGTIGSNKINITCLKCGNVFRPGAVQTSYKPVRELKPPSAKGGKVAMVIIGCFFTLFASIFAATGESWGMFTFFLLGALFSFAAANSFHKRSKLAKEK